MKTGFRMLAMLIAIALVSVAALAGTKNSSTYDGAINFGSQSIDSRSGCLSVNGTVTSGEFFRELKRRDLGIGSEYRKAGKVVTDYPEKLTASIQILGSQCSTSSGILSSSVFGADSYTVTFQLDWKNGMDMRPAALSPVVASCVGSSALVNTNQEVLTVPALTCQVTVDSKGVPLGDHLIVSLYGADGQRITRISAAP
jgi:hypothetical protein